MSITASLTLEQKAALLTGGGFWSTAAAPGLDEIVLSDGPHGVRRQLAGTDHLGMHHSEPATCFPPAVGIGSSWSVETASRLGAALARESRAFGVDVLLGPGVNIKRSPLGGRSFEYYSEDPLISGVLGSAYVTALQAGGVGASLKHFAANDQETDRMVISSDVDERTLREIHLSAFERVVTEAKPATVMCSYNRINGVPASENRLLLTEILREEWGYSGLVVSDWGAVRTRVPALTAGLDLAMPESGEYSVRSVVEAVQAGELDEAVVDQSVERVAALQRFRGAVKPFNAEEHHALARELAADCAVLLKNEAGVLPLDPSADLLVIGEFALQPRFQGGGSSNVNATTVDVPLERLRARVEAAGGSVRFERGFNTAAPDESLRAAAVDAARGAGVAVVFAGTSETDESEGYDRTTLELPAEQILLIQEVSAAADHTIVVLSNGGVVTLGGWHDDVDAVLEGFLLGQGAGDAIAALLTGEANPSGRLAESIPLRVEDNPSYLHFPGEQGHVRYGEGVMVGYRYYETVGAAVQYPFGHGLSYTDFEVSDLTVDVRASDFALAQVKVTNVGGRTGGYVVQAYVATDAGPVRRPRRTLAQFAKVVLEAGESRLVELPLDRRAFAYWDVEQHAFAVASGSYTVQINADASSVVLAVDVDLEGDTPVRVLSLQDSVGDWLAHPDAGPFVLSGIGAVARASGREVTEDSDEMRMMASMPMNQVLNLMGGAIDGDRLLALAAADRR
ncbi:glycoside hydrolase family 3 C-terminal domain-containing protein [Microbacterium sp. KSW2-21]|uniref:Glycoside hydrolase family 3 C-terminal domain-containing protein n=1 Tax=Microbacterium algihabitans TaxID=3075992 RepID=A0ABU3S161_9MICO|nr:glycoside hydrolase family 3 C-terminal domain-containing protein [Microbacterium sp. KSW2-21]MDU0328448.1 glycoside hydrolase family 3 C-terminal domain-containing protein [Microbacterium sp. KSW2-21]